MPDRKEAKQALDKVIQKSRVHLYKPIQVAEILYRDRKYGDIDLARLETYRTKSKKWRDDICIDLLGRVCTSSAKFQDNLFEDNAVPPIILEVLGEENRRTSGAVEAYIYRLFSNKHNQLEEALNYCLNSSPEDFNVKTFIDSFWNQAGLRRSLDKIYEIVVYALFSTLVDVLGLQVEISVSEDKKELLDKIAERAPMVVVDYTARLKERISELLDGNAALPEERILTEAAIFADKCSIDEEITRLDSHLIQMKKIIDSPKDAEGKKLDFLVQEMNREANTIGSKANDISITGYMLEIKSEIEKIREQVQNIE